MNRPYGFQREYRTAYSEGYTIMRDDGEVGRVDLHFTTSAAHATLCVLEGYTEDEIQELINQIDEQLVMSCDPYREDFIVTVWAGHQVGVYSDEDELDIEEEEEELNGDGHRP